MSQTHSRTQWMSFLAAKEALRSSLVALTLAALFSAMVSAALPPVPYCKPVIRPCRVPTPVPPQPVGRNSVPPAPVRKS